MTQTHYRELLPHDYPAFLRIYEESFPPDERRPYADAASLRQFVDTTDGRFRILGCFGNGQLIGFISYWVFDGYHYIEHFAVDSTQRGNNIGGRMLDSFLSDISGQVLLEVELPEDEMSRRRIAFYERHGFRCHHGLPYRQPPYSPELSPLPMLLMTHGQVTPDPTPLFRHVYRSI